MDEASHPGGFFISGALQCAPLMPTVPISDIVAFVEGRYDGPSGRAVSGGTKSPALTSISVS